MLNEKDLANKPAGRFAYAAALDASRYSDECRMTFTPSQRAYIETFRDILVLAYTGDKVFINFRKKMISIKITNPQVRDRKIVREVDEICAERGYVKARTEQGLLYRIPKVA
jgi:hypothetical protein